MCKASLTFSKQTNKSKVLRILAKDATQLRVQTI